MELCQSWHSLEDEPAIATGIAEQLGHEVSPGHPLFGLPVRTLGRRDGQDDVLFALDDGSGGVAVVHLTYISNPPDKPPYPWTIFYPSLDAWRDEEMSSRADG